MFPTGDDDRMLSSRLSKPSAEVVNGPTMEAEKITVEDLKNAEKCQISCEVDSGNEPPFDSKEIEAVALKDKFDSEAPSKTAGGGGITEAEDTQAAAAVVGAAVLETQMGTEAVVDGGDREEDNFNVGLVAHVASSVESEMEEQRERNEDEKSGHEIGDEAMLAAEVLFAETPALEAEIETAVECEGHNVSGIDDHQLDDAKSVALIGITHQQVEATVDDPRKHVRDGNVAQLACAESASVMDSNVVVPAASVVEGNEVVGAEVVGSGLQMVEEDKLVELKNLQEVLDGSVGDVRVENMEVPMDSVFEPKYTNAVEQSAAGFEKFVPDSDDVQTSGAEQPAEDKEVTKEGLFITQNDRQICGAAAEDKEVIEEDLLMTHNDMLIVVAEEPAAVKEVMTEELLTAETEMGMATIGDNDNTGLERVLLVNNVGPSSGVEDKGEDRRGAEVESFFHNKMETETGMDLSKDLKSNSLQFGGAELKVAAKSNKNLEALAEDEIASGDTKMEIETEVETESKKGSGDVSISKLDDSVALQEEEDEDMAAEETVLADTELETETDVGDSGKFVGAKRKRGKNSKVTGSSNIASRARKEKDEDVCFICFDGGDLVLCDRRGCPKAYHPSCVNRDDAFFRAKGRWNCGWHICSICEKNANYMCYTCTFSLCKGCFKNSAFLCVRRNKGFCETCMRTVKLIENGDQSQDAQINFDDKNSWEFLFKDYYTELKSKLSLSSLEIAQAKNNWRVSDPQSGKEDSSEAPVGNKEGSGSEDSTEAPEAGRPKRKNAKKQVRSLAKEKDSAGEAVSVGSEGNSSPDNVEWASKELLEFVMHMKNGDRSVVSQFDVQALLLEYIKRNKLRDPRRKSQIICDSRLQNLFGKPRVGHFEMLKLLESHFLVKEDSQTDEVQGSVLDTEVSQLESNENADTLTKGMKDKKRKIRKRGDNRGPQSNRYDYAAIDMHNTNLIYMRRKLMEDLLEDTDEFHGKVVGTFVRIRISGNLQKQDLYRLVQVVGTSKVSEPYKVGKRTTDIMLEILNLNKTEIVSIDSISNQDFTEEECKRLRQSIKCGLLNRMTVGDILDKAMEVQAARVNDWLEAEIQRLSHLRDRASDMGRKKELRECVEKLQILKTPEERMRRLEEIPQIHADPNMDPNHESDEDDSETDDNKQEVFFRSRSSGFSNRGRRPVSPGSDFSPNNSFNGRKVSSKNWDLDRNLTSRSLLAGGEHAIQGDDVVKENTGSRGREKEIQEPDNFLMPNSSTMYESVGWNSRSVIRSESVAAVASMNSSASLSAKEAEVGVGSSLNSSASLSPKETENALKINESQKMWRYQDPSGKVQGPFSIVQLRKWSNTGYFPAGLRIWRTTETQDEAILLTDALAGRLQKELPSRESIISAMSTLQAAHVMSGPSKKTSEVSLQLAREGQLGEKPNVDQNHGSQTSQMVILKGAMAPPVEVHRLPAEKWTGSELVSLPSPTPKHGNTSESVNEAPGKHAAPYHGGIQSSTTELPDHGNPSSLPGSVLNSCSSFPLGPNSDQNTPGSVFPLQVLSLNATGEPQMIEKQSHLPVAQDSAAYPIQSVKNQNPRGEVHGWSGPVTQKVETSPSIPVPAQAQAYSQWGAIPSAVQNVAGSLPNSGPSASHQPEFWATRTQVSQPNMQHPVVPPALRPENSNAGWGGMQGAPNNMSWVGPTPGSINMNWGTTVQSPAPGNGNSGWMMAPVNLGSTMQDPTASNVNPGWVPPPGNPGAHGLAPGVTNSVWVGPAPNMASIVQVPIPGNGWALPPNPGGPVQGTASGNKNHGWAAPSGTQGPSWGNEEHPVGGKFSGQRNKGLQGGDYGFGGGRPWNGQQSFGNGGPGCPARRPPKREMLCPYNQNRRCVKGERCDYRHA